MPVNRDKPHLWKADTAASVDFYNKWFMESAPKAFREEQGTATRDVENTLKRTRDFSSITPELLLENPSVLSTLRMACCPPLAVDRLIGLSGASKGVVKRLEKGKLPIRMPRAEVLEQLARLVTTIDQLLDRGIFPWLADGQAPTRQARHRAATIVADRLCGSRANPIIRNAQEQRQLALIEAHLVRKGYRKQPLPTGLVLSEMERGTFAFHVNLLGGKDPERVKVPIDAVVQPRQPLPTGLPLLVEAKSAGDYTNPNKRWKEEATKARELRARHGDGIQLVLFLCGYFDDGYLRKEAGAGLDWVWEHRIEDFEKFGI